MIVEDSVQVSVDTCLREQSLCPQFIAVLLQFCSPLFELTVQDEDGGHQDDQHDAQHHQEGRASRVGDGQTLAGEHSVVLVARHAVLDLLWPTPALAALRVPHL